MRLLTATSSIVVVAASLCGCGGDNNTVFPDARVPVVPDAGCEPGPDAAPSGKALGDVSGTWAVVELSTAVVTGPLTSAQISRNLYTFVVTQTGTELSIVEHTCDIEVDDTMGLEKTRMLPTLWPNLPVLTRPGALVDEGGGHFTFTTQDAIHLRGVTMEDPVNDPMPARDGGVAPGVVIQDTDMDDHPGVTLLLDGLLRGQAYVVQRDHNAYTGTQSSPDQIDGHNVWSSEQVYLGSMPQSIADLAINATPDPDPSKHTFQLIRIPDGSDCSYVVDHQCQLFDGK
jgi:hypothetical protein